MLYILKRLITYPGKSILDEMGVPRHLISLRQNIFENNIAYIRVERELINSLRISIEVFHIYGEWILGKTPDDRQGAITNHRYQNLQPTLSRLYNFNRCVRTSIHSIPTQH